MPWQVGNLFTVITYTYLHLNRWSIMSNTLQVDVIRVYRIPGEQCFLSVVAKWAKALTIAVQASDSMTVGVEMH